MHLGKFSKADIAAGVAKWAAMPKRQSVDPTPWKVWRLSKAGKRIGKNPIRQFSFEAEALEFKRREEAEGFFLEVTS